MLFTNPEPCCSLDSSCLKNKLTFNFLKFVVCSQWESMMLSINRMSWKKFNFTEVVCIFFALWHTCLILELCMFMKINQYLWCESITYVENKIYFILKFLLSLHLNWLRRKENKKIYTVELHHKPPVCMTSLLLRSIFQRFFFLLESFYPKLRPTCYCLIQLFFPNNNFACI